MSNTRPPRARKALGQHFLANRAVVRRTVELLDTDGVSTIVEIGPGRGALTGALLETGKRVIAVEPDRRMIDHLSNQFGDRLGLVHADILETTPADILPSPRTRAVLVGNLPYNLSGPILGWIFASARRWQQVVVMLQLEVARRLVASPATRDFGPLAIARALHFEAAKRFNIRPGSFKPPPKVDSAIVELRPAARPPVRLKDTEGFMNFARALFGQRRKTIRNNIRQNTGLDVARTQRLLVLAGVNGRLRGEQLTWSNLECLFQAYGTVAASGK